jgi:ubiquinone biosynthesis protein UbiJ
MSVNQLSAAALQTIARRLLSLDVEASKDLQQFDSKVIHIHIENFKLDYYFNFVENELFVSEQSETKVSASISGRLSAFVAAAAAEHSADTIFKGKLNFSGEIATAKQFQSFAQKLNIDWHEPLAQFFGDPLGHTLATGLEKLTGWLLQTAQSVGQDISEYVQEEARVTPSVSEQQHFFRQVDQLRSRADRLNAKISQLKANQQVLDHSN